MEIVLNGGTAGRHRVVQALEDFSRENAIARDVHYAADLAVEEHITNVLAHGGATEIVIRCRIDTPFLVIEAEDNGKPFDPSSALPPDTKISLKEKPVGGLGIHLMRQFMDEISYSQQGTRNLLRMKKRLFPRAP